MKIKKEPTKKLPLCTIISNEEMAFYFPAGNF